MEILRLSLRMPERARLSRAGLATRCRKWLEVPDNAIRRNAAALVGDADELSPDTVEVMVSERSFLISESPSSSTSDRSYRM